jgi:hypothetical protein
MCDTIVVVGPDRVLFAEEVAVHRPRQLRGYWRHRERRADFNPGSRFFSR